MHFSNPTEISSMASFFRQWCCSAWNVQVITGRCFSVMMWCAVHTNFQRLEVLRKWAFWGSLFTSSWWSLFFLSTADGMATLAHFSHESRPRHLRRGHTKETGNRSANWGNCIAVSSICAAPFSIMCSTQADNNSRKLRLRCGCQFPLCALALILVEVILLKGK
jgi:hypothetical protein